MGVEQLASTFEAYVVEAHRLKSLHASSLSLLVGLETEYIDDAGLDALVALVERHGTSIQYLVGSVHHCEELPIDFDKDRFDDALSSFAGEEQEQFSALFSAYFDAQYTLLDRLRPEIVGHFDLCRLYYPELDFRSFPTVWAKIERNIKFAVEYGALFELNASAFRKGWSTGYPGVEVFYVRSSSSLPSSRLTRSSQEILKLGGRFTLSDDSHGPLAVGLHYDKAYNYLRERGVEQLWYLAEAEEGDAGRSRGVVAKVIEGKPWLEAWPKLLLDRK